MKIRFVFKGGEGSGHYGHAGRPGKHGGSAPGKGEYATSTKSGEKDVSKTSNKHGYLSRGMKEFEDSSAVLNYERAAVYDKDGREVFRIDGKETEVTFSDEQVRLMKGAIITHNHPDFNGKFIDGGSFSFSDVQLLANSKASEVRAISKKYVHTARPVMIGSTSMLGDTAMTYARGEAARLKSVYDGRVSSGEMSHNAAQDEYWHTLWTNVAEAGWIEYERIPR